MYEKLFALDGRTALVTGGSRGLGKAIARAYAEHGANIMICSRNAGELETAAKEIADGLPIRVEWVTADLAQRGEAQRLADETLQRFGRVDVLVNNAGSNIPEPADAITDEAWDRILELNLSGIMRLTRALLPQMMERRWGRVIHISSVLGLGGKEGRSAYSATKSALIGMARSSALDAGPSGVTVNCISPGPFLDGTAARDSEPEERERFAERAALKRWGQPEEIAGVALLLGTDAGSYITRNDGVGGWRHSGEYAVAKAVEPGDVNPRVGDKIPDAFADRIVQRLRSRELASPAGSQGRAHWSE